jgi:hypothetical protein
MDNKNERDRDLEKECAISEVPDGSVQSDWMTGKPEERIYR